MLPYFTSAFANASSGTHTGGRKATAAIEVARENVASLIGANPESIIFTGSATESNNLALLGMAANAPRDRRVILTTAIEHKSVLGPASELQRRGFDVRVLPVDRRGRLEMDAFRFALSDQTFLVSVQAANNEVGTVQDVATVAEIAHEHGVFVHCDAVQAVGRIDVDVQGWDVDLLSLSAHKIYGPKGIAALYVRGATRKHALAPIMYGGSQEGGLRPGTLNVPAVVGFGQACNICQEVMPEERARIGLLRDRLEDCLLAEIPEVHRNGDFRARLPGNSSITISGVEADALIANLPQLGLSTGSACTNGALDPSHVLLALGMSRDEAYQTLRVGLGRFTTQQEVDIATMLVRGAVARIRNLRVS